MSRSELDPAVRLVCQACNAEADPKDPFPFRCPAASNDDDVDHLLVRHVSAKPGALSPAAGIVDDDPNPFVRYRRFLASYQTAMSSGVGDAVFVDWIRDLDASIAAVDGRGFRVTPFGPSDDLSDREDVRVWIKNESNNVGGSHKARHLFAVMLHLKLAAHLGSDLADRSLAIASCGNAAIGAAVVARASDRLLSTFVPEDGHPATISRLRELGAKLEVCVRTTDMPQGDPCYLGLQKALEDGAIPFTVQARENGLVVEGGLLIGYEMAAQLAAGGESLDRLFIQVGGGTLATSVIAGLREALAFGLLPRMPVIHAVQTASASPLQRAFGKVASLVDKGADVERALEYAAHHRSRFMWPWETKPHSVAYGILDDETYDWLPIVRAMLETGGHPLVVSEQELMTAHEAGNEAMSDSGRVCATGTAGLAGLEQLRGTGGLGPDETVGVLFTGVDRE